MTTQMNIDTSHSAVTFTVRHMVFAKVRGGFASWKGTLAFDEQNPAASRVEVKIDAASIDTKEPKRDAHLRSADFFDVEKFPELTFTSTAIEVKGQGYRVQGDLTIHGVTRPVTLDAEYLGKGKDPWGQERIAFVATTKINRKDFGLAWNQALETAGVLVGEDVEIGIDLQATKIAAAQAA